MNGVREGILSIEDWNAGIRIKDRRIPKELDTGDALKEITENLTIVDPAVSKEAIYSVPGVEGEI